MVSLQINTHSSDLQCGNSPEQQNALSNGVCVCLRLQEPQWKGAEGGRTDGSGLSSAGGSGADRVLRLGPEGTH